MRPGTVGKQGVMNVVDGALLMSYARSWSVLGACVVDLMKQLSAYLLLNSQVGWSTLALDEVQEQ